MKLATPQINLLIAWGGILLGFLSGSVIGLRFHRDDWLGGFGSFKRRLYRLAHISLFGLGAVNFAFYLTVQMLPPSSTAATAIASWAFVAGAFAMPVCCVTTAHFPSCRMLFVIPVLCVIWGGTLTMLAIAKL